MNCELVGTRNDFMYQNVLLSIMKAEKYAKDRGEKIYLVVMSAWMYDIISEHVKSSYSGSLFDKYCTDSVAKPIMGYQVSIIEQPDYSEPVKFITGKGS